MNLKSRLRPKKIWIYFLFFSAYLLPTSLWGQNKSEVKYEFGKISPSDFESNDSIISSDDAALIMADFGQCEVHINFNSDFEVKFETFTRMKILKSEALKEANQIVVLYSGTRSSEKITSLNAIVHNLENGEVVSTKLRNREWSLEPYDDNLNIVRYTLPNVKVGSIIEIEKVIRGPFIVKLPTWNFENDYPTRFSQFKLYYPEMMGYKMMGRGYLPYKSFDRSSEMFNEIGSSASTLSYKRASYNIIYENVAAFKSENLMDAPENYRTKFEAELGFIAWENAETQFFYKDWNHSTKEFLEDERTTNFLNPKSKNAQHFDIDPEKNGTLDGAKELFALIRDNMVTNDDKNYLYPSYTPAEVYTQSRGSRNAINWMLIYALRSNGFKAYPLLLTARDEERPLEVFPIFTQFSTVITALELDGEYMILDPSNKLMAFSQLPTYYHNGRGMVANPESVTWVTLNSAHPTVSRTLISLDSLSENTFSGQFKLSMQGRYAEDFRKSHWDDTEIETEDLDLPDSWTVHSIEVKNLKEREMPIELICKISIPAEAIGTSLFLPTILYHDLSENPLTAETRKYPVNYPSAWKQEYICQIKLSENLTFPALPESKQYALPESAGSFSINVTESFNVLTVRSVVDMRKPNFEPHECAPLRVFYDLISNSHSSLLEIAH